MVWILCLVLGFCIGLMVMRYVCKTEPLTSHYAPVKKIFNEHVELSTTEPLLDLQLNDRVVLNNQRNGHENGIYVLEEVIGDQEKWAFRRAKDLRKDSQVIAGKMIRVENGPLLILQKKDAVFLEKKQKNDFRHILQFLSFEQMVLGRGKEGEHLIVRDNKLEWEPVQNHIVFNETQNLATGKTVLDFTFKEAWVCEHEHTLFIMYVSGADEERNRTTYRFEFVVSKLHDKPRVSLVHTNLLSTKLQNIFVKPKCDWWAEQKERSIQFRIENKGDTCELNMKILKMY